ncbi:MAG TPA: zinc-dependent peptidase, partial [Flavisolibacter sp.]|nr:zinc-dependent peptidase [Flavisolibacter sp.]
YRQLRAGEQQRFIQRLLQFMKEKNFIIKDDEGVKDMPVLTSAAAIQISFGLAAYTLPFYRYIRIYPEEYFADLSFRILTGNVQGNTITIAWNHLLKGYENASDGSNLALHEMAHALYIQKIVIEAGYSKAFSRTYHQLIEECKPAHQAEIKGLQNLYSDYAEQNLQEFWAESVELFFEKPAALHENYPAIFQAMVRLLNQDPVMRPILFRSTGFR